MSSIRSDLSKNVEELAALVQDFLPGPGPGCAITAASFQGIARELDLQKFWQGQSKAQSVKMLLDETLMNFPEKFPVLILKIVLISKSLHAGRYSFSVDELSQILNCLERLDVKIPELYSDELRNDLPIRTKRARPTQAISRPNVDLNTRMRMELVTLMRLPSDGQGYALEQFLNKLFIYWDLAPLAPFRQQGDLSVGILKIGAELFHLYAAAQMIFSAEFMLSTLVSVSAKEKCFFLCLAGFSQETKIAFGKEQQERFVAGDLRDLFLVLDGGANLEQMVALKLQAGKQGKGFLPAQDLLFA